MNPRPKSAKVPVTERIEEIVARPGEPLSMNDAMIGAMLLEGMKKLNNGDEVGAAWHMGKAVELIRDQVIQDVA